MTMHALALGRNDLKRVGYNSLVLANSFKFTTNAVVVYATLEHAEAGQADCREHGIECFPVAIKDIDVPDVPLDDDEDDRAEP